MNIDEKSKFEWRPMPTKSSLPAIRINSQAHVYKDNLLLFLHFRWNKFASYFITMYTF